VWFVAGDSSVGLYLSIIIIINIIGHKYALFESKFNALCFGFLR